MLLYTVILASLWLEARRSWFPLCHARESLSVTSTGGTVERGSILFWILKFLQNILLHCWSLSLLEIVAETALGLFSLFPTTAFILGQCKERKQACDFSYSKKPTFGFSLSFKYGKNDLSKLLVTLVWGYDKL